MSIAAANPHINATVTASAGSGKTWMLVTRILRLLLDGAEPGGILALTFTRKAAGEMQQRLAERLYQLATLPGKALDTQLEELGLPANDQYRERARQLYEFHQYCDFPVRTQTFHSFCQDILARFPLEANVPPDFDLLESSSLLIRQARDALFNEAALDMHGTVASNLEALMIACDSLFNLEKALHSFLDHRSDWWAYTEGAEDPCAFATENLRRQLEINPGQDPISDFFSDKNLQAMKTFARLLAMNPTATNIRNADDIAMAIASERRDAKTFADLTICFLTKDNKPRARKDSKTLRDKLKAEADHFLELAEIIPAKILATRDLINRQKTFELNRLWYTCGSYFLQHYQQLKKQLRMLDFTDLEWCSYQLLQSSDNAMWVQYKLDQRIDHLLIDEFQDTNPTQWQLILPLLEEMASTEAERPRSVFLVGDEKQSIYSFRRAKPELQAQAAEWLQQHLQAQAFPLNKSWRSSPAIISTVNAVFVQGDYPQLLPGFSAHETHQQDMPGKVVVFPLLQNEKTATEETTAPALRNPLLQPREEKPSIYLQEGKLIADSIKQLMAQNISLSENSGRRRLDYQDIYILVRKRSHLADYEQALRQAGIPYLGANRGTLLDCIEIQDMEALLDTLLTPFNNLALAQVLKSPLFNASDDDLMLIARHKHGRLWIDRLAELSTQLPESHPLQRAHGLILQWRQLVDRIPVHDLLDRIYSQADILRRYRAATPDSLRPRVQANLTRFLELALELDSGRYPSLMHFLQYIRSLKTLASDAPDEAPMEVAESRVKIMTIHASKGLEAPVVFLADSVSTRKDKTAIATLVDWPAEQPRPQFMQLIPSRENRDSITDRLVEKHHYTQQREDANLLYVALTRARQMLFVSGCQPDKGPFLDWHTPVSNALQVLGAEQQDECLSYSFGELESRPGNEQPRQPIAQTDIDPRLLDSSAFPIMEKRTTEVIIAPSRSITSHELTNTDEDAQTRGLVMHRCLELLCADNGFSPQNIRQALCEEMQLSMQDALIDQCLQEAQQLLDTPALSKVFHPPAGTLAYNECPVHYMQDNKMIYGVIDRLLLSDKEAWIIDYKSHRQASNDNIAQLAQAYEQQMLLYAQGIARAWPDKKISAALLFTRCGCLHPVSVA